MLLKLRLENPNTETSREKGAGQPTSGWHVLHTACCSLFAAGSFSLFSYGGLSRSRVQCQHTKKCCTEAGQLALPRTEVPANLYRSLYHS